MLEIEVDEAKAVRVDRPVLIGTTTFTSRSTALLAHSSTARILACNLRRDFIAGRSQTGRQVRKFCWSRRRIVQSVEGHGSPCEPTPKWQTTCLNIPRQRLGYNHVFKANASQWDGEPLPPSSHSQSSDKEIDLPDNDMQVATVATNDGQANSTGRWQWPNLQWQVPGCL